MVHEFPRRWHINQLPSFVRTWALPRATRWTCTSCHDSHGSTNGAALRESISAKTGTPTVDALMTVPVPGGADLRFFCGACHIVGGVATHPGPLAGGADLSIYPQNCMASGCHTHVGTGLG